MVEITVVLPVPAYPLSTKSYHFDLQLKNSNLLKKNILIISRTKRKIIFKGYKIWKISYLLLIL
jgi:hypothetical protein